MLAVLARIRVLLAYFLRLRGKVFAEISWSN